MISFVRNSKRFSLTALSIFLLISFFAPNFSLAAARSTPFAIGETLDPGADAEACGPLDANCFVSVLGVEDEGVSLGTTTPKTFNFVGAGVVATTTGTSTLTITIAGASASTVSGDVTGTVGATVIADASSTARGFVSTTTQTFAGDKTFTGTTSLATTSINSLSVSGNTTLTNATSTSFFANALSAITGFFSSLTSGSITATSSLSSQGTLGVTGVSTLATTTATLFTTSGNVGVGTASPSQLLSIDGSNTQVADGYLMSITEATGRDSGLVLGRSGRNGFGLKMVTDTNDYLAFQVSGTTLPAFSDTPKMVLNDLGNLGIGTTTPSSKLVIVDGANTFSFNKGASDITPNISIGASGGKAVALSAGTSGSSFVYDSTGIFAISTDTRANIVGGTSSGGTARLTMSSTGNVSIGMASNATGILLGVNGKIGGGTFTSTYLDVSGGVASLLGNSGVIVGAGSNNLSLNGASGVTYANMTASNGMFRFGSTAPTHSTWYLNPTWLNVTPNILVTANNSSTTAPAGFLFLHNDNTTASAYTPMLVFSQRESNGSHTSATAAIGSKSVSGSGSSSSYNDGELMFYTSPTTGTQGLTERMRITQDGNIGIGTTSPSAKLSVTGSGTGTGRAFAIANSSNAEKLTVLDNGSVGIGTTNPAKTLDVAGSIQVNGGFYLKDSQFLVSKSDNEINVRDYAGGVNTIGIGGLNYVRAGGSGFSYIVGNLGIGTTSPTNKLHVAGTGSFLGGKIESLTTTGYAGIELKSDTGSGYIYQTGVGNVANPDTLVIDGTESANGISFWNGGNRVRITSAGNVGIGTTTPTAQLSTTGTVRFSNFGAGTLQTDASGNLSVSSDERLKNIEGQFSRGLSAIEQLTPINYRWNAESGLDMTTLYTGFSAQNVQQAIPEAVGEDGRGLLTLSDRGIIATIVNAVKEISKSLTDSTVRLVDESGVKTFAGKFFDRLTLWFADAQNGIQNFFAKEVITEKLCVKKSNGEKVCVTGDELDTVLNASSTQSINPTRDAVQNSTSATSPATITTVPEPYLIIDTGSLNNLPTEIVKVIENATTTMSVIEEAATTTDQVIPLLDESSITTLVEEYSSVPVPLVEPMLSDSSVTELIAEHEYSAPETTSSTQDSVGSITEVVASEEGNN